MKKRFVSWVESLHDRLKAFDVCSDIRFSVYSIAAIVFFLDFLSYVVFPAVLFLLSFFGGI